ncbi:hypothetical protein Syun_004529 [Stephania yunnanensis]|uniref:Uncharacterized protein n=1 Tax=Stephania yunnanensis TaxID=152371 RepID=A0AAP0Q0W6_9MAGN
MEILALHSDSTVGISSVQHPLQILHCFELWVGAGAPTVESFAYISLCDAILDHLDRYKLFNWRARTHFRHVALEDLCEDELSGCELCTILAAAYSVVPLMMCENNIPKAPRNTTPKRGRPGWQATTQVATGSEGWTTRGGVRSTKRRRGLEVEGEREDAGRSREKVNRRKGDRQVNRRKGDKRFVRQARRRRHRHHRKQIPPPASPSRRRRVSSLRGDLWRSVYLADVLEYLAAEVNFTCGGFSTMAITEKMESFGIGEVFVAAAYKKGMEWKASKMLLPYKQLCSEKKVKKADRLRQVIEKEMLKVEFFGRLLGSRISARRELERTMRRSLSIVKEVVEMFFVEA